MKLTMKEIRKELLLSRIVLPIHVQQAMEERGYLKKDIISCIWSGEINEIQIHRNEMKAVVEGFDADGSPMVVIIGFYRRDRKRLAIISAFPPIKSKYKRVI